MVKVNSKTTLAKILKIEGGEEVLAKHGVPCISCPMASLELNILEIGKVCKMYKLDLKGILKDLNKLK